MSGSPTPFMGEGAGGEGVALWERGQEMGGKPDFAIALMTYDDEPISAPSPSS